MRATATPPKLEGFEFVKLLGSGGFSDVFLYDQKFPKRRVAVKVLITDELSSEARASFTAEANLMAKLSAHPYIVTIFHADVAEGDRPFFVMEYCSGPSLGDRYKREKFSVADVLQIGIRLSSAIATAHSAGILHRDIKPANVLTNDFGWPALTDFGISSTVEGELPTQTVTSSRSNGTDNSATTASASVGMSIPWSPPEMFEDDPKPDVRSDVFSLAATIYTLLAGHTPFEVPGRSNSSVDLVGRIVRGSITPLERSDVPRSLIAVLQKGMSPNREERFATAVDFARALQRVELELSYSPTAIDVPNLNLTVPERTESQSGSDPDATRVRSVSTVQAQSPNPTIQAEATKIRSVKNVEPSQAVTLEPAVVQSQIQPETTIRRKEAESTVENVEVDSHDPNGRRKILIGIISTVLIAAVVVLVVLFGFPKSQTTKMDSQPSDQTSDDGSALGGIVPTPVLVSKEFDGKEATFSWSNPSPEDGDSYLWTQTNGPSTTHDTIPISESKVSVKVADGESSICIEVSIRRTNGTISANPLEVCAP